MRSDIQMQAKAPRKLSEMLSTAPRFARVAAAVAVAEAGHEVWTKGRQHFDSRFSWQVAVSETDPAFRAVHAWMVANVPESQHRNLVAMSADSNAAGTPMFEDGPRKPRELAFFIDDETSHRVDVEGHSVKVWVNNPRRGASGDTEKMRAFDPVTVKFSARTQAGQRAVMRLLQRLVVDQTARKPALRMVTSWGSWQWRMDVPARTLDSVILPPAQKQRVVGDLERFLADEPRYAALGAPWHRAYMFYGPPGTGKTSLVKALATHFGLDLWYAPLSDLKDETSLMSLISEVSARSVLLLEDIDTVRISHDREQDGPGITMSSLLNALDGVATPHGLIVFMTTNHFEALDDALTRKGRMDVVEEIAMPSYREVDAMFEHFYGRAPGIRLPEQRSQADIAEIFKRHMDDYEGAVDELTGVPRRAGLPGSRDATGGLARHPGLPPLSVDEVGPGLP